MFGKPTWTWNNADYSYRFMKNTYFKAFDSPWMDVGAYGQYGICPADDIFFPFPAF